MGVSYAQVDGQNSLTSQLHRGYVILRNTSPTMVYTTCVRSQPITSTYTIRLTIRGQTSPVPLSTVVTTQVLIGGHPVPTVTGSFSPMV